jgi:CRP-like cAMP-binding protein
MIESGTLQKYSLFGGLDEEQVNTILPLLKQETFEPNELIITEGKPNDKVYFLISGQVAVVKKDIMLTRFCEGDAFGEVEVLDVMAAAASIKSTTQVKTLSISNKTLREIYKIDIKIFSLIIMNLARDLSRRLRRMDDLMASTSSPPILY